MKTVLNMPGIDWTKEKNFIKQEGFYLFGGCFQGAVASNELWILISEMENLRWVQPETLGSPPEPRYQHAMTLFEREHALLV